MDCEKYDRVVLDMLYDELDELTHAAAKRHMDQCARCREIGSGLRATREVGVLPMIEPPDDLEARILEAEQKAHAGLPLRQRFGRAVSILAGYAMRPQLAMAALLMLMIGSSLLLLRAKPGERDSVQVTERGVPESEGETVAIVPLPERENRGAREASEPELRARAAAPRTAARGEAKEEAPGELPAEPAAEAAKADKPVAGLADESAPAGDPDDPDYDAALALYHKGSYAAAVTSLDRVASKGGKNAPMASLFAAQAARINSGCRAATPRFEQVNLRYRGTGVANEATWQAADCYRVMGNTDRARKSYESLLAVAGYGERAQRALDSLGAPSAVASRSAAPAAEASGAKSKKAAAKPAAKPKAAPPKPAKQKESVGF